MCTSVTATFKRKKGGMLRKATKVHMYVQWISLFSKPERTSWSLTPQLDTIIIQVSSVKGLSLRGNPLRLYRAKHLPWIGHTQCTVTQDFTMAKLTILTWRYLYLLKMRICETTDNLGYDQKCSPFSDHTNVSHDLQLLSLVQVLRYVHHSQAAPTRFW